MCSELARTLFPVESTKNIEIKITHYHRVIWDGLAWETLMSACWVNQSVFYQVLNGVSDDVLKENVY